MLLDRLASHSAVSFTFHLLCFHNMSHVLHVTFYSEDPLTIDQQHVYRKLRCSAYLVNLHNADNKFV